jgi:MYXO-CTERM domain-containing protein
METGAVGAFVWLVALVVVAILFWRQRRRRGRLGAGGAGSVYDMLNEDKRNAVEIIVEERAAARDPEDRDGNLPDLEAPKRR